MNWIVTRTTKLIIILSIISVSALASDPVIETSFISPKGSFPQLHSASLTEIPSSKQLMGCWYAGSREMGTDVQIYCSKTDLNKINWSAPKVAVASNERHTGDFLKSKSMGNPVVFHDAATRITYLFFGTVTVGGWRGVRTFLRISNDLGQTWSASIPVEGSFGGDSATLGRMGKFVRTKVVQISDSEFILPMYSEWDDKRSFTCSFKKQDGVFKEDQCAVMPGHQSLQPALVAIDQKLLAYTRSKNGSVQYSQSDIGQQNWSALQNIPTPNPDSSVDVILGFSQKDILLVGNARAQGRNSLDLLVSKDYINFVQVAALENSNDGAAEFSYPTLARTSDGFYHVAYTHLRTGIKHVRFNEAWLQLKIKNAP